MQTVHKEQQREHGLASNPSGVGKDLVQAGRMLVGDITCNCICVNKSTPGLNKDKIRLYIPMREISIACFSHFVYDNCHVEKVWCFPFDGWGNHCHTNIAFKEYSKTKHYLALHGSHIGYPWFFSMVTQS